MHDDIYGSRAGQPFAAFVLDFDFGCQPAEIEMLSRLSRIGAAVHAPCIAGASPEMFQLDNFSEFTAVRDIGRVFVGPHTDLGGVSRQRGVALLALALPRVLLRLPYGSTGVSVEAFAFEEDIAPNNRDHYLWGNAAYAFGARLTAAFADSGWCAAISGIESGWVEGFAMPALDPSDHHAIGPVEVDCMRSRSCSFREWDFYRFHTTGRRIRRCS